MGATVAMSNAPVVANALVAFALFSARPRFATRQKRDVATPVPTHRLKPLVRFCAPSMSSHAHRPIDVRSTRP
jgi:hypothetical protein